MNDNDMQLTIPTYDPQTQECDESQSHVLTLRQETGLRVVLGDPCDPHAPDLLIERHRDRWYIVVHPDEGDPLCVIEIDEKFATVRSDAGDPVASLALPVGGSDGRGQ